MSATAANRKISKEALRPKALLVYGEITNSPFFNLAHALEQGLAENGFNVDLILPTQGSKTKTSQTDYSLILGVGLTAARALSGSDMINEAIIIVSSLNEFEEGDREALKRAKKILVCNDEDKKWLYAKGLDENKVSILDLPLDISKLNPNLDPGEIKRRYNIGPVDNLILFVGQLEKTQFPETLMLAIPQILKKNPQARFVFVGDGELFWPLKVQAHYLFLEYYVRIIGHLEGQKLYELIQSANLIIAPKSPNSSEWVLQIARLLGVPAINVTDTQALANDLTEIISANARNVSVSFTPFINSSISQILNQTKKTFNTPCQTINSGLA